MASARYLRNINMDELNEKQEPEQPMTKRQKWDNFWFYHKWHVVAGFVLIIIIGVLVQDILSKENPDYTIGILTRKTQDMMLAEQLQAGLETICDDRNGDGKVLVEVVEYVIETEDTVDAQMQMANVTRLAGDLDSGTTMMFLTNDIEYFQNFYGVFAYNNGDNPEEGQLVDYTQLGVSWSNCPSFMTIEWGELYGEETLQETMQDFLLVRRTYQDSKIEGKEKIIPYYESAMALFEQWTGGQTR